MTFALIRFVSVWIAERRMWRTLDRGSSLACQTYSSSIHATWIECQWRHHTWCLHWHSVLWETNQVWGGICLESDSPTTPVTISFISVHATTAVHRPVRTRPTLSTGLFFRKFLRPALVPFVCYFKQQRLFYFGFVLFRPLQPEQRVFFFQIFFKHQNTVFVHSFLRWKMVI